MDGIKKFEELLMTDETFRTKLKAALESYTGEQTEEKIFDNVLTPLAAEYGITANFEDVKKYISEISSPVVSEDELAQISGGTDKGGGVGVGMCLGMGFGAGAAAGPGAGMGCALIGLGFGSVNCTGKGETLDENPWIKHL